MPNSEKVAQIYHGLDPYGLPEPKRAGVNRSLLYGETLVKSVDVLLEKYIRPDDKVFYDLGSGKGNVVIQAALSGKFKKTIGIELVQERHAMSVEALKRGQPFIPPETEVRFINGDFLSTDFSDGDIIYITATAFSKKLIKNLQMRLNNLKPGTRLIITDKQLDQKQFSLIDKVNLPMDYAESDFYIYEKK
jgi:predicted RNA methylase